MQTCRRPLAQKDGPTASIVDVRALADRRVKFRVARRLGVALNQGVTVEFWSARCSAVRVAANLDDVTWARFEIPDRATWMTVTSPCIWVCTSFSGVRVQWTLW